MRNDEHVPLTRFRFLERVAASAPALAHLEEEIPWALAGLELPESNLRGRTIAVTAGSRGIANLREIIRAVCTWLKARGAQPFVIPAMGSHGGATAEGQRQVLAEYGVTADQVGAEIRSSMETVIIGTTPEGFPVHVDRNAWEADGIVVMNRIKPHTDFSGTIESGLLKMMAVGLGKYNGATQTHRSGWKYGFERTIRALAGVTLASGKVLCGLSVIENELHQVCALRASRPEDIVANEEKDLARARTLVPRIPLPEFQLLIVDELGKNISGAGMDTKVIGRGVELHPGEAPAIKVVYVRDLSPESEGNAIGVGLADIMHERLYRKIDLRKTIINGRVSLNVPLFRMPFFLPSDRDSLDLALGHMGTTEPDAQRLVWIRSTLELGRLAVSEALVPQVATLPGWQLAPESFAPQFDERGDLCAPW